MRAPLRGGPPLHAGPLLHAGLPLHGGPPLRGRLPLHGCAAPGFGSYHIFSHHLVQFWVIIIFSRALPGFMDHNYFFACAAWIYGS